MIKIINPHAAVASLSHESMVVAGPLTPVIDTEDGGFTKPTLGK
jgi:hypothetical protein